MGRAVEAWREASGQHLQEGVPVASAQPLAEELLEASGQLQLALPPPATTSPESSVEQPTRTRHHRAVPLP